MDKKGIGVIVVSVFIILLTVSAIALTWFWIVPWFNDMEVSQDTNANLRIVLEGYTAYDVERGMAFVQIKRGADDLEVDAMDVIFKVNGNTVTFRTKTVPDNNQVGLYYFNFSKEELTEAPQFVKVAPVFYRGIGVEEVGFPTGDTLILTKKVKLDDWEAARVKAEENVLKDDFVAPDVALEDVEPIVETVDVCKDDFEAGDVYVLDRDYILTSGTCFTIDVSNVVLDFAGHTITGNNSGYGVWITGRNVTVKNGSIENFERGIFIHGFSGNDNNQIIDNYFFNNTNSLYIFSSYENVISGNNMTDGDFSNIYLDVSGNNNVTDNWACGSSNDFRCDSSNKGNIGSGNIFSTVIDCSTIPWSLGNGGYTKCEG